MNTLIVNPTAHRAEWVKNNPHMLVENGGLFDASDLERWACDVCIAPLDPSGPIRAVDDHSLCDKHAPNPATTDYADCTCAGCQPKK